MLSQAFQDVGGLRKNKRQLRRSRQRISSRRRLRLESLEARRVLATLFWQGDVSTDWSAVGNWADDIAGTDTGNVPDGDDVLVFDDNTGDFNSFDANNDIVGLTGIEIEINDSSAAFDFTLGGPQSVGLGAAGIANGGSESGFTVINMDLTLAADTAINHGAGTVLALNGTIDNGGNLLTITNASGSQTDLNDVISGAGGLTMSGGGTVLNANNTYGGLTTISSGSIIVRANGALGSTGQPTVVEAGGFLDFFDSVGYPDSEPVTLNGGTIQASFGSTSFAGDIALTAASRISTRSSGNALELTGSIVGGFGFDVVGDGTVTLAGANGYSGATSVEAGTLVISGSTSASSTVTVTSGAALAGSGNAQGPVNVLSGGTISPGTSPGTIMTGDLDLMDGSNLAVEIDAAGAVAGVDYDEIEVTGSVTIGNVNFNLSGTEVPSLGDEFIIIDNDGAGDAVILGAGAPAEASVVGMLNGVPLQISYVAGDGNDVALSVSGTLFWQGDIDSDWSTAGNWAVDLAGTSTVNVPANDSVLVFNTNTVDFASFVSVNDIVGLMGIEIQIVDDAVGDDFTLGGVSVGLAAAGISSGGSDAEFPALNMDLTMAADTAIDHDDGTVLILNGTIDNGGNLLTITNGPGSLTDLNDVLSGAGGLTTSGGVTSLAATNTFGGGTTVTSGTLVLNGSTVASSQVTVTSGATLAGVGNAQGPVDVENGGAISPGLSPGTIMTGDLDLMDGSKRGH